MLNITASRRAKKQTMELNMTPLIDMVFILLIFFLVTTSFVKETGIDISRPTALTAVSKIKSTILIGVTKDNAIYLDKLEIDIRKVQSNIERIITERPENSVIIVADKDSFTGIVITVMDACKLAGVKNVSIAATPPQKE